MMSINDDDKGFEFDVNNGNRDLNQQRYEAIGEVQYPGLHNIL